MNPSEFARKIKDKYPEYKDVDDLELSQKIVAKYPEYKDQVTFEPAAPVPEVQAPTAPEPPAEMMFRPRPVAPTDAPAMPSPVPAPVSSPEGAEAAGVAAPPMPELVKETAKGLSHGLMGIAETVGVGLQYVGAQKTGKDVAGYWEDKMKGYEISPELEGSIVKNPALMKDPRWWAYNLADMSPSFAAAIIPGVAAGKYIQVAGKVLPFSAKTIDWLARIGTPVVAGVAGGTLEGSHTFKAAKQMGLKAGLPEKEAIGQARVASTKMIAATAGLNAISFGKMMSSRMGTGKAIKHILGSALVESGTEWAEEPTEAAILERLKKDPKWRPIWDATVQGVNVVPIAFVMGGAGAATFQGIATKEEMAAEPEMPVEEIPSPFPADIERARGEARIKEIIAEETPKSLLAKLMTGEEIYPQLRKPPIPEPPDLPIVTRRVSPRELKSVQEMAEIDPVGAIKHISNVKDWPAIDAWAQGLKDEMAAVAPEEAELALNKVLTDSLNKRLGIVPEPPAKPTEIAMAEEQPPRAMPLPPPPPVAEIAPSTPPAEVAPEPAPVEALTEPTPEPAKGLEAEARKYKTAGEFVESRGISVLHGTGTKFDVFDDSMRGSLTGAKSAKGAIWFTDDPATAKAYSVYSAEEGVVKKGIDEADRLERIAQKSGKKSDWDKHQAKIEEYEDLASYDKTLARREGANIKEAIIKGDLHEVDAQGKSPQELSEEEDIDSWLNLQIEEAKKLGKDGVVIKNLDDAVGLYDRPATHYAIFDAKNIKTKSQLTDIWQKAQEPPPAPGVPVVPPEKPPPPTAQHPAPEEPTPEREPSFEKKVIAERMALRQSLRRQAAASREAAKVTKEDLLVIKRTLEDVIKAQIPLAQQGKFMSTMASIQTQKGLDEAIERVDEMAVRIERGDAVKELRAAIKDVDLKKVRPEYRDALEPIISAVDPVKRMERTLKRLRNLAEFVEKEPDNQVPQKVLNELKILSRRPIIELSKEEVESITDTIKHLVRLNELKNRLIIRGKLREADEIRVEATDNLKTRPSAKPDVSTGLDAFEKEAEPGRAKRLFTVDAYNAELKSEILDGKESGVIEEVVYDGIDKGVSKQLEFEHAAEDYFKDKLKGIDVSAWSNSFQTKTKNVDRVEVSLPSNRKIAMSKGERISFYLDSLNENNKRHLLTGGFSFPQTKGRIIKIDEADLEAIVESMTPEEVTVAKAIHGYFNTVQKDKINEVSVFLNGHDIAREPNYFPIRTHSLDRFKDELIKTGNYSQRTLEGMGMFKERQNVNNALILDDAFIAIYKSMKQVASYYGLAVPLRSAKMLLNDNQFQITARNTGANHYVQSLKAYLKRIEDNSTDIENVDRLTQDLINKLDIAILGLNPWVMAKQPVSLILASTEMDLKYITKASASLMTGAEFNEMRKWSPQLRDRLDGNVTRELGEIAQVGGPRKFFTGKVAISSKFMEGIRRFDQAAVGRIWRAVKLEISEAQPDLKGDAYMEAVAERAWKVIRRTQPTFHIKDRSPIGMSRNVLVRISTKYTSQRNKNYMIVRRAYERYNRSAKTAKDKGALAGTISLITLVTPLMLLGIDELRDITYGRNKKKTLFQQGIKLIKMNLSSIYFLGDIFDSIASKVDRGTYAGYDVSNPLSSTINELTDTISEGVSSIEFAVSGEKYKAGKKKGEEKWKNSISRFGIGVIEMIGKLKGIPVHTARRLVGAGLKMAGPPEDEEKKEPATW